MMVEILDACRKVGSLGVAASQWYKITADLPVVNEATVRLAVYDAGYEHICRRVRWREIGEQGPCGPEGQKQWNEAKRLMKSSTPSPRT